LKDQTFIKFLPLFQLKESSERFQNNIGKFRFIYNNFCSSFLVTYLGIDSD